MTTAGFYESRRMNPRALAVVVLLHGAALAALVLVKGEEFRRIIDPPTTIDLIEETKTPPERTPPPPQPDRPRPPDSHVTVTPRDIELPFPSGFPAAPTPPLPSGPIAGPTADPIPDTPLPPPPAPAPRIEPAHAKANLGSYVSDADYPAAAIRSEEHGTTRFRLAVAPDGRVTDCIVTGSSGSSSLDSATCRIMKARARFSPAHDSTGRPTSDSVASAIRWVLPEG